MERYIAKFIGNLCVLLGIMLNQPAFSHENILSQKIQSALNESDKKQKLSQLDDVLKTTLIAPDLLTNELVQNLYTDATNEDDTKIIKIEIEILGKSGNQLAKDLLFESANSGKATYVTLFSLGYLGSVKKEKSEDDYEKAGEILLKTLSTNNPNLKFIAITSLEMLKYTESIEKLYEMLGVESHPQILEAIAAALIKMGKKNDVNALLAELALTSFNPNLTAIYESLIEKISYNGKLASALSTSYLVFDTFIRENTDGSSKKAAEIIDHLIANILNDREKYLAEVLNLSETFWKNIPKGAKQDSEFFILCSLAYSALEQFPDKYIEEKKIINDRELWKQRKKHCDDQLVLKQIKLGEFYLSKYQIKRNPKSIDAAIRILSKVLLESNTSQYATKSALLLLEGFIKKKDFVEAKRIYDEISQNLVFSDKEKRELNKLQEVIDENL